MTRSTRIVAVALVCGVSLMPLARPATPCSYGVGPYIEHVLDPNATDDTPPEAVTSLNANIKRGVGASGCLTLSGTSCDDLGLLTLEFTPAQDDQTPPNQMGYILVLTGGELPTGESFPEGPLRLDGSFLISWIDGATDEQEPLYFSVEIYPVDLAGNVGEPTSLVVTDDAASLGAIRSVAADGCQATPRPVDAPLTPVWVLLLVLVLRPRRA